MKRLHIIIFLVFLSGLTAGAKKHKQLVVLHTNDTHSTILPLNPNIDNKDLAGRGGFLRRINMIKEQRSQHPNLLLFDSGDFSQGSGYYTLFKGEVEIGLMNQMGYDAATIGNHEFDFGMDNMAKLFRMANFPIVCSNYDCSGTVLEGLVKPYITIQRDGVKIGVFALAPPLKGLVFDGNCEGITFLDPAETAQKYINILRRHSNMLQTRTASRFLSTKTANTECSSENSFSTWKNSLRFAVYGLQMICWQAFLTIEVIICKLYTI